MPIILLLLLFYSVPINEALYIEKLFLWNVGQGQWLTLRKNDTCLHFDVGGELAPKKQIFKECRNLKNKIYLSHGDWDHINQLFLFFRKQIHYCIDELPKEKLNIKKQNFLRRFKLCNDKNPRQLIKFAPHKHCTAKSSSNCYSRIYEWKGQLLIPGDSPRSMEKYWLPQLNKKIEILVLGHHGSHSSTSNNLLHKLSGLNLALCSARKQKYGHPAKRVRRDLQKQFIPLLCTEEWGNIIIEL